MSTNQILQAHGERLRNALQDVLGDKHPTKFIVTRGDGKVCERCLKAESDGVIPYDQPYRNGMQHPSFHGHTCRCKEMTSGELVQGLDVKVTSENEVTVGFFEEKTAQAASIREYGSGNGPPEPTIRHQLDTIDPEFFNSFFDDLAEYYTKQFMV